jgi:hypothetical protein
MGINLSISGCPAYGHDIAGYQSATNPPSTKELFFRWTELGAFSPVMRTHHGTEPSMEWAWNSDADSIAHYRRYAIEHIQLAPFFEALARDANVLGTPMFRGLFLSYPDQDIAWTQRDEYLLGDSILVAPVVTQGATSRDVWLPPGTWFPWGGGAPLPGDTTVPQVSADVGEIPVYARAGSLIVRYPDRIRTLALSSAAVPGPNEIADDRDLLVFLGGSATFDEATGPLTYSLQEASPPMGGTVVYSWNGAALATCAATPVAPCAGADDGTGATLTLVGPGSLTLTGAANETLTITGGSATRALTVHVRR